MNNQIPDVTVARLPIYRRVLAELSKEINSLKEHGGSAITTISSEELAARSGVNAAQVRKDISYLGSFGTPGVGYEIAELSNVVSRGLGLSRDCPILIVGIGNLGTALANYQGFAERGFPVTALFDANSKKVGKLCAGLTIQSIAELAEYTAENKIAVGVIAVPGDAAQELANYMVDCGIRSILNFAPILISVPEGINLRQVDLSVELQVLSFYLEQQSTLDR